MHIELTDRQKEHQARFHAFVQSEVAPHADQFDQEERISPEVVSQMAHHGYLGSVVPAAEDGTSTDMITFGILNEELGRGCSSVRSLLTVHSMVAHTIFKWGTQEHKRLWLPQLVSGEIIGAFALSEPNIGSDAKNVETTATLENDQYVLQGRKKWITFAQIAHLFIIFAQCDGKVSAVLVERSTPGLTIDPIYGVLGTRASMLGELHLNNCRIPKKNLIGGLGFGLSAIATSALDIGRYSVACGSVGIAQACLDASLAYTSERKQFGTYLRDHQLIQQMITDMVTNVRAARLLCYQAGYLKDAGDPETIMTTWVAKYFASVAANKAALDAVQIHGANGCSAHYPVQRYLRDAKVMEIIEGSSQIQQINIARHSYKARTPHIS
ncbi:MAG: acyl-CoA dehydrogenase family protein [Chloroflexota bacterium]